MKILLIAATHGNELLGVKLYERLLKRRSVLLEHIDFLIGNPRAYANKSRYVEYDLNRAYRQAGGSYEHQRARQITEYIRVTKPEIVLDMHTTNCIQPPCLIVPNLEGEAKKRLLRSSHILNILQVEPMGDIATLGDSVVGYEVPSSQINAELLDAIAEDLQRFIDRSAPNRTKRLFKMQGKIYKRDVGPAQARTFVNFQMHTLGYVPIMTGENSYKRQTDYLGFKASAPEEITV